MVEITYKIGDITVDHTVDIKLVKSLLNLEQDKIVLCKESEGDGLIGEFLSDFLYLPDALLHHDRLLLPRPKEFYIKEIGEKILDSNIINKLQKNNIIYFPLKEFYDIKESEKLYRNLIHEVSNDPRSQLIALIESPYNDRPNRWLKRHGFIDKNVLLKPYYAGGADSIVEWLNTVDLDLMYTLIPANVIDDPILAERDLIGSHGYSVFLTTNVPVIEAGYFIQDFMFFDNFIREQRKFDKPTETTLSLIFNKLSNIEREKNKDLIEKGIITQSQIYEIPFTLEMLIDDMPKNSCPSDLIDIIIKKRKERSNREFRKWLKESDNERRKNFTEINIDKIRKIDSDIEEAAEKLHKEFPRVSLSKKILKNSPNLAKNIIEILVENINFAEKVSDMVDFIYNLYSPSHIAYMQKLGKAGKTPKQFEDVFGEQGRKLNSIFRYYSAVDEKTDRILKLERKEKRSIGVNKGAVAIDGSIAAGAGGIASGRDTIITLHPIEKELEYNLEITGKIISVITYAEIVGIGIYNDDGFVNLPMPVKVYRIEVRNKGKAAVKNVCGTIEFDDDQPERRICWYEGNTPYMTLNPGDNSFLDVYGILFEIEQEDGYSFLTDRLTNNICIPESGWKGLNTIVINSDLKFKIRVTAENSLPERKTFIIDSKNKCELKLIK